MAGKMPTGLRHRPGWSSRNGEHIEAKSADEALRIARRHYGHPWYPVHAAEMGFRLTSANVREAIEARGNRLFRVHFHRVGYRHFNCPFAPKVTLIGRAGGPIEEADVV